MRLVNKEIKMHPDTFAPELLVTVALPMEPMPEPDQVAANHNDDVIFEKMGKDFIELIKSLEDKE